MSSLASPKKFLKRILLFFRSLGVNLLELWRVLPYYCRSWSFLKADVLLASRYFFRHPHFHINRKEESFIYGPTPLSVWALLAKEASLSSTDVVYDLGSGTGRGLFWLAAFVGCRTKGIDLTAPFIRKAEWVQKWCGLARVAFEEEDIFLSSLEEATCIYLYGTCFNDGEIERLAARFRPLRKGTKVITVSYPLTDFDRSGKFAILKHLKVAYPWGKTDVYLHALI